MVKILGIILYLYKKKLLYRANSNRPNKKIKY